MMKDNFPARSGILGALWLCLVALLTAMVVPVQADVFNYAPQRRQIKACVLVTNTIVGAGLRPQNAAPHVFYVMERRTDVKPGGWEFVNPLAPTTLTGGIRQRWVDRGLTIDPTLGNAQFRLSAPVLKNMGAYWEVNLDTVTSQDLQQFDIVYLGFLGNVSFSPEQREKLRHFADAGGTIWFEDLGNMAIAGAFPIDIGFTGGFVTSGILANPRHPLVNYPYSISPIEALLIGRFSTGGRKNHTANETSSTRALVPILTAGGQRYISAADFGAGHIVVSSAGIAASISAGAGGPAVEGIGNSGAISGENFVTAQPSDLKFAYNIVAFTSSVPTGGVNSRRTGAIKEQIGNGLGRAWSARTQNIAINPGSGVAVHKGVAFFVDGRNVLRAFDLNPGNDLDGDQNPDDGIPDPVGSPHDQIWRSGNANTPSQIAGAEIRFGTPTIVSYVTPAGIVELVVVTSTQGITRAYLAFPANNGRLIGFLQNPEWAAVANPGMVLNLPPNTPALSSAFSEGIVFAPVYNIGTDANNPWHIAALSPIDGLSIFGGLPVNSMAPASVQGVNGMGDLLGTPSVGYVRDVATNAIDKVIYAPTRSLGNTQTNDNIHGVWFSTKNEPLVQVGAASVYTPIGDRGKAPWYMAASGGNRELFPRIYRVFKNPVTGATTTTTYVEGDAGISIVYYGTDNQRQMRVVLTTPLGASETLHADYTLNWPRAVMTVGTDPNQTSTSIPTPVEMNVFSSRRFTPFSPDPNTARAAIIGSPAMSGQDALIYNVNVGTTDDRTFALRDQINVGVSQTGRRGSGSEVIWAFGPNSAAQYSLPNAQTIQIPPRLINTDTFIGTPNPNIVPSPISNFRAIGSPAVSDNVAYVIGSANLVGIGNATVIMALNANPSNTFSLGQALPNDGTAVILRQIDPLRSQGAGPVASTQFIRLVENDNFTLDRSSGTVTITNYRSNQDGDSFNAAMPIFVTVGATQSTTPLFDSRTGRGPLDNLIWYMIIPQTLPALGTTVTPTSGLSVIGKTLHFGTAEGRMASIDISGGGNGSQLVLFNGSTSRLQLQDVISQANGQVQPQPLIHIPVGATNTVLVASPLGLSGFDNRLTLIADNNRILQVDYAGNAVWSASASRTLNVVGGVLNENGQVAQTSVPFARPNVVKHNTLSSFLIADTGNNRVLLMDKGGMSLFELRRVNNDLAYLRPNDPLTLNQPTDVQLITESGIGISITNRATGVTYTFAGQYLANHYFIADGGNNRVIEVIYAYDANGAPVVVTSSDPKYPSAMLNGQVIFATRSLAEQNANYRYRTVQQFLIPQINAAPQIYVAATIDNQRVGSADPGTQTIGGQFNAGGTGGSLVIFKRDFTPNAATNRDGDTAQIVNSFGYDTNNDNTADRRQSITNPTWFKQFATGVGTARQDRYILCDDNGCYVLRPIGSDLLVEWALSADQYYRMTGRRLKAVSMQRLTTSDIAPDNRFYPRYLITNAYSGKDNVPELFNGSPLLRGSVRGEVFEIRGLDYYTGGYGGANGLYRASGNSVQSNPLSAIVWMLPKETLPVNQLGVPIAAPIVRTIGDSSNATGTFLLEQPLFAERPN